MKSAFPVRHKLVNYVSKARIYFSIISSHISAYLDVPLSFSRIIQRVESPRLAEVCKLQYRTLFFSILLTFQRLHCAFKYFYNFVLL